MKDSKLKILLPIVLIPIIFIVCVVGYMSYKIHQYKNDEFKVSEKDITKYLKSKKEGDFKDIKLIETAKIKHSVGGSGCPSDTADYYDEFIDYYTVYSEKYDTEFLLTAEKDIFSVTCYGCHKSDKKITDDFEVAKYKNIIRDQLSSYDCKMTNEYDVIDNVDWSESYCSTKVTINDNFNKQYYETLIQLKSKLNDGYKKLLDKNKNASVNSIYIIFNDKTFEITENKNGVYISMIRDGEVDIEIENPEFWNYVGN